jgi:hypothetical protein
MAGMIKRLGGCKAVGATLVAVGVGSGRLEKGAVGDRVAVGATLRTVDGVAAETTDVIVASGAGIDVDVGVGVAVDQPDGKTIAVVGETVSAGTPAGNLAMAVAWAEEVCSTLSLEKAM